MITGKIDTMHTRTKSHDLIKRIGKTNYQVIIHFSTTSQEIMSNKINHMLQDEVSRM